LCAYERALFVCTKFGCIWVTGAEKFEVLEVTVGVLATERTQVDFVWFYKFQWGVVHVENGQRQDVRQITKHMKMWIE